MIRLLFFFIFTSCIHQVSSQDLDSLIRVRKCSWVQFYEQEIKGFDFKYFGIGNDSVKWTNDTPFELQNLAIDFDFTKDEYGPFYEVTPDSSKLLKTDDDYIIPIMDSLGNIQVTHGEGAHIYNCYLFDLNTQKQYIITQVGSGALIEDGFWYNNHTIIILGGAQLESCNFNYLPWIQIFDLKKKQSIYYQYQCYQQNKVSWHYIDDVKYKSKCKKIPD